MTGAARYEFDLTRSRVPGAAVVAGGLLLAHLPSSVGLPCPLRSLTGVPCPFCGSTTSVRALFDGHPTAAVAAAPLGIVVVLVAALGALGLLPKRLAVHPAVLLAVVALEWVFELHRFHLIG